MCKICERKPLDHKSEVEWESVGLWSKNISAKLAFQCIWKSRSSEEVDSDEEVVKSPSDSSTLREDELLAGNDQQLPKFLPQKASVRDFGSRLEEPPPPAHHAEPSSLNLLNAREHTLESSCSDDPSYFDGKLDATRKLPPPTVRGHRPFFYLPVGSEETSPTAGGDSNSDPQSLLEDPDLYPVPKSLPSPAHSSLGEACFSSDLSDRGEVTGGVDGADNHQQRKFLGLSSGIEKKEVGIHNRILQCLVRARTRKGTQHSRSYETGLYQLGASAKEGEEETKSTVKDYVHHFSTKKSFPQSDEDSNLMPDVKDVGTVTDVCAGENLPEVEIISLVQEQIPCYKLRADVVSEWAGYDNEDWTVPFPVLKESEVEALSPEQAEGALAYFLLCGNRVSQMTRTYHDIDAVTRLLQEKERDLELAARIGQQLLARNRALEEKNSTLEAEICSSTEKITQLKHDLLMKTELLQIYTNDVDDSSVDSTPTSLRHINVDLLQRKVKNLENENVYLREEASQLASDTQTCEEKESELVNDVIRQLNEANFQVNQLNDDLSKKIEDNLRLQEETTQYLAQIVDLQTTNKRIVRENEELGSLVGVARECQQELTTELAELKEKYAEVLDLLHDTQEQLRKVQKKNFPGSRGTHLGTGSLFSSFHSGCDSIASELHSLSSGEENHEKPEGSKNVNRIFDTVRISSRLSSSLTSMGYGGGSVFSTPTKQASQSHLHLGTPIHTGGRYSPFSGLSSMSMSGGSSGLPSLDSGAESDASFPTDSEDNYPASRTGVPGWPGTPDLDASLKRLAPRDRNNLNYLPYGCRTPDSIMSTGSLKSGTSGYSSQDWKLPQKLQIVKPIEGSLTLHQWSRLATPHLGGLLEDREGIAMKGATNANLNLELYSMSDLEEEEEEVVVKEVETSEEEEEEDLSYPGKQFVSTSSVFTYTNSTVLHPDEVTNLTSSLTVTQMSTIVSTSIIEFNLPATPSHIVSKPLSRRGSTATFSTNLGLAKHLRERGFAHEDSSRVFFTATPANSPDISSPGSPEEQSYKLPGFDDLAKRLHAGASFLRRTFYRSTSPPESEASTDGHKINLVERVQALGVERLVSGNLPHSVGAVVTSRPRSTTPLLHLSNLIRSTSKPPSSVAEENINGRSISSTSEVTSSRDNGPNFHPDATMGVPGRPGTGHLDSRLSQLKPGQRADLGTVGDIGGRTRPSALGSVPNLGKKDEKIGTVGWTSLGRKGGLL